MIASISAKQMYFSVFLTFFLNTEPGMEGVLQSCCCFVLKEDDLYDSCNNKTQVRSQRVPDKKSHQEKKEVSVKKRCKNAEPRCNIKETLALFYTIIDMQE